MKTVLTRTLAGLAMLSLALLAAFFTMRLAIHGREVVVPNLAGMSDSEAASAADKLGLNLSVENRFYSSAMSLNHVLSQSPAPGSRVRRGWQVRVTESLGGQKVAVPEVMGQSARTADLVLRRLQLEAGTVAHLPAPAPAGIVLAQSPPPNSVGLNGPKVALLVSDDEPGGSSIAYVMPSLSGLTLYAATAKLATVGLRIASADEPDNAPPPPDPTLLAGTDAGASPVAPGTTPAIAATTEASDPAIPPTVVPTPISPDSVIIAQYPGPGRRVSRADSIRVTLAH